jgi:prepilin-type N-terminal cleavage/methylation domain-containing protein
MTCENQYYKDATPTAKKGFTLIELSVVLVVIGLIIGGILVGRVLIKSAEINSLISQKQEYETAVNAFKLKYGYLPGDMPPDKASQLGFFTFTGARAGKTTNYYGNYGNDDGMISNWQGVDSGECTNECGPFWRHLSESGLIKGSYGKSSPNDLETDTANINFAGLPKNQIAHKMPLALFLPPAKYASNAFIGVSSLDNTSFEIPKNAFYFLTQSTPAKLVQTMTPSDMYTIDSKIDDGLPNTGKIMADPGACFTDSITCSYYWASLPTKGYCTYNGANYLDTAAKYNIKVENGGEQLACTPFFIFN